MRLGPITVWSIAGGPCGFLSVETCQMPRTSICFCPDLVTIRGHCSRAGCCSGHRAVLQRGRFLRSFRRRDREIIAMRLCTALLSLALLALAPALSAAAEEAPPVKGMFLLTDYPSPTVRPGSTTTINLRLRNYALPPERFAFTVAGAPQGWTVTLLGGGQPASAAMVATNDSTTMQLRLDVPDNATTGTHNLTVTAKGASTELSLPISVTLAKDLPAKLTIKAQLPSIRGNAKSNFEYQLDVKNDSGRNLVVAFGAQAPQNFEASFTEQYGSQELNSIPIEAGQSKTVKLKVRPPSTVGASRYPVTVKATAEAATAETTVALEITGQPRLSLAGRDGVLSGRAEAGKETTIPLLISNTGRSEERRVGKECRSRW